MKRPASASLWLLRALRTISTRQIACLHGHRMLRSVRAGINIERRSNHGYKATGLTLTRAPCQEPPPWLGTRRSGSVGETVQSTSEPARRGSKLDCAPCYEKQVRWSMRTHDRSEIALALAVASQGGRRHQNVCPTLVRLTPPRPPLPTTTITATNKLDGRLP